MIHASSVTGFMRQWYVTKADENNPESSHSFVDGPKCELSNNFLLLETWDQKCRAIVKKKIVVTRFGKERRLYSRLYPKSEPMSNRRTLWFTLRLPFPKKAKGGFSTHYLEWLRIVDHPHPLLSSSNLTNPKQQYLRPYVPNHTHKQQSSAADFNVLEHSQLAIHEHRSSTSVSSADRKCTPAGGVRTGWSSSVVDAVSSSTTTTQKTNDQWARKVFSFHKNDFAVLGAFQQYRPSRKSQANHSTMYSLQSTRRRSVHAPQECHRDETGGSVGHCIFHSHKTLSGSKLWEHSIWILLHHTTK